jgi:hypothetical protein
MFFPNIFPGENSWDENTAVRSGEVPAKPELTAYGIEGYVEMAQFALNRAVPSGV